MSPAYRVEPMKNKLIWAPEASTGLFLIIKTTSEKPKRDWTNPFNADCQNDRALYYPSAIRHA